MLDRISNLPDDVTENIVSRLPLREATRTSVLSSKWRYKSAMLQDLAFDDKCLSTQRRTTFVNVVDHVLLLHIGPLCKFMLYCINPLVPTPSHDIDRWVTHLSRNSIKQLIVYPWTSKRYNMPSSLFSCQDLVCLESYMCLLSPPSTFRGFRNLKYLTICYVNLSQVVVENLISCSPLLKRITARHCDGFTNLKIDAPNLDYFLC
ncbi:putative F-box domain, leucine-rich repeat domain, L domain-containing protein [Rosa chinensis]|uniref:Putative F-box domain, leucine-rich repeat domain, L domain-containing protein n=1 Tax=Rosa chinensis TaxID=74649 RepID=A0A2P6PK49_ROSCH|nr:putative F-box domain, leucine-rich repeat domain, L domain-containing protein [Rosa chinensis]